MVHQFDLPAEATVRAVRKRACWYSKSSAETVRNLLEVSEVISLQISGMKEVSFPCLWNERKALFFFWVTLPPRMTSFTLTFEKGAIFAEEAEE